MFLRLVPGGGARLELPAEADRGLLSSSVSCADALSTSTEARSTFEVSFPPALDRVRLTDFDRREVLQAKNQREGK